MGVGRYVLVVLAAATALFVVPLEAGSENPEVQKAQVAGKLHGELAALVANAADGQLIQVTVVMQEEASRAEIQQASQLQDKEARRAEVMRILEEVAEGSQQGVLNLLHAGQTAGSVGGRIDSLWIANVIAAEVSADVARQLAARPDVDYLVYNRLIGEEVFPVEPERGEGGPLTAIECGVDLMEADRVWGELGITGNGVVVCVIDTGCCITHPDLANQIWYNPGEIANNSVDDDGNGFIDDIHGIAFDLHALPTTGSLYSMDEATRPVQELQDFAKGMFDMEAAVDSPEATALKKKMASLGQDEIRGFIEDLTRYTLYSHGTHVAGIAVAGNPAARVLIARLTGDPSMVPEPPTMEYARNGAKSFQDAVAYFKQHGVRVVNMSWGITRSSIERDLELNKLGKDADERKTMAREMFDVLKTGLHDALAGAPEILFCGGAGNSDNDITFDEFVPSMFELPNLFISGAVDQAGEATTFTSFGPTVNIYANGFEVDSYVPGGDRIKFSGTSMSAPNVANLAAKLLALNPALSPAEVTELILTGADEFEEGEQRMRIVHPVRSAELLHKRMSASN